MNTQFSDIVRRIINTNIYLTIATAANKNPWANAVFYAADAECVLYFTSYTDSLHVKNLIKNPSVAVTIFDSHQPAGTGEGVQIKGSAYEVKKEELPRAIEVIYAKRFPDPGERKKKDLSVGRFTKTGADVERIYKIIPRHFYILDPREGRDERIEVRLS